MRFFLILGIIFLISCHDKNTSHSYLVENYTDTISIDCNTIRDSANIDTLIESIELLPIIEDKDHYIGDVYKLLTDGNKIIIHDRSSTRQILLFSSDGNFEKKILGIGHGPNEALQIDDCWLNKDGTLEAYDFAQKKIYQFSSKTFTLNNYIKAHDGIYHNLLRIPETQDYLGYSTFNANNEKFAGKNYQLSILNSELKPKKGFLPFGKSLENVLLVSAENHLRLYGDTIRFSKPYDNTLYSFYKDDIVRTTFIRYNVEPLTSEVFDELTRKNSNILRSGDISPNDRRKVFQDYSFYYGSHIETSRYVCFTSVCKSKSFTSLLSKATGKIINANFFYETKYKLRLPEFVATSDGYLIGIMDAFYFDQYLMKGSEIRKQYNPDDSTYILVRIKLK